MSVVSFESVFTKPQTPNHHPERSRSFPHLLHAIGRLTSANMIEQTAETQVLMRQHLTRENAHALAADNQNEGTSVNDERLDMLLTDFDGDITQASGYLLEVTAAIQTHSASQ